MGDTLECLGESVASDAHMEGGGSEAGDDRPQVHDALQSAVSKQRDLSRMWRLVAMIRGVGAAHLYGSRHRKHCHDKI